MNEGFYQGVFEALQAYGYVGAFLISVLGSLIPFLPVPYLIPIVLMSKTLDPLLLGILAGIGGAIGKLTSYGLGRFGRRLLKEERRRKMTILGRAIGKYGALAVFLFALTPLPDDIIYIPIGLAGFDLIKFMFANALGKIILSWIVAYGGRLYFDLAGIFLGQGGGLTATFIALIAMIIITILLLRIDWEEVMKSAERSGFMAAIKSMINSMISSKTDKN
ncbi:MAG: VTT domain-containing protein [Thaumarchaeota archaeon]|nr:VTT domain-containing protein [Nitrososphaerota archaeon]